MWQQLAHYGYVNKEVPARQRISRRNRFAFRSFVD